MKTTWKCSRQRERNISILKILHLSFLISNMTPLILLFTIKFTIERQINHSIVFLQVFTSGINNQNLTLQTYHKSTHTGPPLNFKSFTSFSYKISLIKYPIDSSFKIFSNWKSFHNDTENIKSNLIKNAYLSFLINSH